MYIRNNSGSKTDPCYTRDKAVTTDSDIAPFTILVIHYTDSDIAPFTILVIHYTMRLFKPIFLNLSILASQFTYQSWHTKKLMHTHNQACAWAPGQSTHRL